MHRLDRPVRGLHGLDAKRFNIDIQNAAILRTQQLVLIDKIRVEIARRYRRPINRIRDLGTTPDQLGALALDADKFIIAIIICF